MARSTQEYSRLLPARLSDLILAFFLVAVIAMLLVPLPTPLLDILLALNLAISLLVLLAGLYIPGTLSLLSFPSLLLLTTLFRLALNVASARLILSQGDAGEVIEAFGRFLVRGDVAVGIIVFTIITIVNFIVIARGAARVAEVAARFTLDALPGKQGAIDADLRSGLITAQEAQARREGLRQESQFYGAMDGSMRFIQGDAIAGFLIILTNIVGGLYVGISGGLGFAEAIETYTILTVGDGLVTQIPALLISICAGIVVTRVASREQVSLSTDVGEQLFRRPSTLVVVGSVVLLMAALPGLPVVPFALVSAALFVIAARIRTQTSHEPREAQRLGLPRVESLALPEAARATHLMRVDPADVPLLILLDGMTLFPAWQTDATRWSNWWADLQHSARSEFGLPLPEVRVAVDSSLTPGRYSVHLAGNRVLIGTIPLDVVMIEAHPAQGELLGFTVKEIVQHPLQGGLVFWAPASSATQRVAQAADLRCISPLEYIALSFVGYGLSFPEELITLAHVHDEVKELERRHPGLLESAVDRNFLNLSRLTEIMQDLVREGLSVRDLRQIIEQVAAWCSTYAKSEITPEDFDRRELVDFIRGTRKRHLVGRLLGDRGTLRAITLSEGMISALREATLSEPIGVPQFETSVHRRCALELQRLLQPLRALGRFPPRLLVPGDIRARVGALVRSLGENIPVVSREELDPSVSIDSVGVWQLPS